VVGDDIAPENDVGAKIVPVAPEPVVVDEGLAPVLSTPLIRSLLVRLCDKGCDLLLCARLPSFMLPIFTLTLLVSMNVFEVRSGMGPNISFAVLSLGVLPADSEPRSIPACALAPPFCMYSIHSSLSIDVGRPHKDEEKGFWYGLEPKDMSVSAGEGGNPLLVMVADPGVPKGSLRVLELLPLTDVSDAPEEGTALMT
jgi:hypothetical protein